MSASSYGIMPRLCLTTLILAHASGLDAQGIEDYARIRAGKRAEALRIDEPIELDGRLDEPVWQRATPAVEFYQQAPREGALADFPTEVRFLYDDTMLYVGAMLYDDEPDKLIVNELSRDFSARNNDFFGLVLDLFRDRENGLAFVCNPGGAMRDTQIYDNGRPDANWNGVWVCSTEILENGWSVEYAIPFKALRFPKGEVQEWGLQLSRMARRINQRSYWSPVPRPHRHNRVSDAGVLTGIRAPSSRTSLRVKPYAKAGIERGLPEGDEWSGDGGVDVKWGLTSSLALDGTYRTDFSQVEADAQQINLTRFSLFFPEKREFFLENRGSFQIGLASPGGENNRRDLLPFFTRRIGLSSQGQPIPVVGGLRLTGREGRWGIGLFNMQTRDFEEPSGDVRPGDNFTAIRMTRTLTEGTALGGFYFGRESNGMPAHNRVAGFDWLTQTSSELRIEAFGMHSTTDAEPGDWAGRAGFSYQGNTNRAHFFHVHVGDDFRHDLGFVRRKNIGLSFGKYEKILRPQYGSRWVREHTFGVALEAGQDSGYQELQTRIGSLRYSVEFQDGGIISARYDNTHDLLNEPFDIYPGVVIPEGTYNYGELVLAFQSNPSAAISGDFLFGNGSFWSGERTTIGGGLRVRFDEHVALLGSLERNSVVLPEGSFVTYLETMRLNWSFTPRMFLDAFVQYNSEERTWLSNVRFNLIHRPLSDIYVVWNETRGSDLKFRSVIVKYTHMLAL